MIDVAKRSQSINEKDFWSVAINIMYEEQKGRNTFPNDIRCTIVANKRWLCAYAIAIDSYCLSCGIYHQYSINTSTTLCLVAPCHECRFTKYNFTVAWT